MNVRCGTGCPATRVRGLPGGVRPSRPLRELQASYEAWRENLPASLESSATADRLDAVCELDIEQLDIELPRGFGRD